jgi:predicted dehydrogenase
MPSSSTPRIAVIGGGHLGRIHAKLLANSPKCELVCVADPDPHSQQQVQQLGLPFIADYRQLDGSNIDGVIVATPTFLHGDVGSWFLSRGISCFVEKPIASSVQEAKMLGAIAEKNGCTLQVGHVERFNPVWTTATSMVRDSAVRFIEATREGTYAGRSTDIGVVLDLMIHDIDLILSLVPSTVDSVDAYGWAVLGKHEDFAVAHLRFRDGTIAQIRASRVSETQRRCMQIFSEDSSHDLDFVAGRVTQITADSQVASGQRRADELPLAERLKVKDQLFTQWLHKTEIQPAAFNAIEAEHREFLSAIQWGAKVSVDAYAATQALQVAEQIVEAIHKSQSVPILRRFAA